LSREHKSKGTQLAPALRYFNNVTRQRSISFVLSDFIDSGYDDALRVVARKHDLIGIKLYDRMDMELPNAGMMQVEDLETGERKWVDSSNAFVRKKYQEEFFRVTAYSTELFRKAGCDLLHVRGGDDYVKVLQRFFLSRNR
jgi:hypothetical protein